MFSSKAVVLAAGLIICIGETSADQKCHLNFGTCQETSNSCSGTYLTHLCEGPYDRKCCVPAFNDEKCHARTGKCQITSVPCLGGNYVSGLCGGPSNRRCCISESPDTAYNDAECEKRAGKCLFTNIACVGGSYVTGLCGGPANRRCCIPKGSSKGCGRQRQRLACALFNSTKVIAEGSQTPAALDKPYANLRDMCEGRRAVRSKERCTSGCRDTSRFVCVHAKVLRYLVELTNNGRIVIDELAGACHSGGCAQQRGKAVDVRRDWRIPEYIQKCLAMGGTATPHAGLLHCEF